MLITGIYLQCGGIASPTASDWSAAYNVLEAELSRFGVIPGYDIIDNYAGSPRYRKRDSIRVRNVNAEECKNVETIAMAATPPGMAKPGWNWFAQCQMSYLNSYGRLSVSFLMDSEICPIGSEKFEITLRRLAGLANWDFGWAMTRDKERSIDLYLGGVGAGDGFTPEDRRSTSLWYEVDQPEERRKRLRDIFPYNIVGSEHLAQTLADGRTLRAFIESDVDSKLRPLADNLWLWTVNAHHTKLVHDKLRGTGLIIAE